MGLRSIASAPPDMSEVVEKLGQVRAKLASLEVDGNKSLERIEAAKTAAEEKALFIDNQSKVVGENSAAVLEKRNEADEQARLLIESALRAEERSLSLLEKVDEIISRASDVKATVDAYKESFTAFDNQLEARSRQLEQGSKQLDNLSGQLQQKNKIAESVIENAKEALGWGTVQSLTQSFSTSAEELKSPARWATGMVFVSLLVLSVWVVLVFILPARYDPSLRLFTVPDRLEGWAAILYVLGNLGVRVAVASPALLFALFCLNRYHNLSTLREQYIFKKTVASAIPGFKEQAAAQDDPHSKAMTLAAFERLLFNPTEVATKDFGGRNGGGWLSKRLTNLVRRAMDEARG